MQILLGVAPRPESRPSCPPLAFTLVELLVVITIIVVLLTMLTPAMDKAIYQAEMTVCMANHAAIAKGATTYAMGYKRYYPYRPTMMEDNGCFERIQSGLTGGLRKDDRPVLRQFIGIKTFNDPLNGKLDYDTNDAQVWILPSTCQWYGGTGLIDKASGRRYQAMTKVGDRRTWSGPPHPRVDPTAPPKDRAVDYLSTETDWVRLNNDEVRTAHPDDLGILQLENLQGQSVFLVINGVRSRWIARARPDRGMLQQNYSYADGSVRRRNDIELHDPEQTFEVPEFENGDNFYDNVEHLPVD